MLDLDLASTSPAVHEAQESVRKLATGHYENFSVLSHLVPRHLRDDFAAVYAYCRWSDDLGDETGTGEAARARSLELLGKWRAHLDQCFAFARGETEAQPVIPVFVALAQTIRRHGLSPEPFHHLIDAFEQDQHISRYDSWDQLLGYCSKSANPVGRIVLGLCGHDGSNAGDDERIALSDSICTALQLTNFWQDVQRDLLERDRVYVPKQESGMTPELLHQWLAHPDDPESRVPYIRALRPLVHRTRELFQHGHALPDMVHPGMKPVIWLFLAGGESVLTTIERTGCTTLWRRPVLSRTRKVWLLTKASGMSFRSRSKAGRES